VVGRDGILVGNLVGREGILLTGWSDGRKVGLNDKDGCEVDGRLDIDGHLDKLGRLEAGRREGLENCGESSDGAEERLAEGQAVGRFRTTANSLDGPLVKLSEGSGDGTHIGVDVGADDGLLKGRADGLATGTNDGIEDG
jgi:hypothetical protein